MSKSDELIEGLRILLDSALKNDHKNFNKFKWALRDELLCIEIYDFEPDDDNKALDNLRYMNRKVYYKEDSQ